MATVDAELVIQVKRGDRKAFAMLVDRYQEPIFNVAYRMMHNTDDADDITQAAFVKAYEKIDTFNPAYKFFNWLYKIAVNESLNVIKRRQRRAEFEFDPPAKISGPEEDLALSEMSQQLQTALDAMKMEHRLVILLKHLLLLSYSEISGVLDIPEKTVKSRLFSARQVLRKQLVKQGHTAL